MLSGLWVGVVVVEYLRLFDTPFFFSVCVFLPRLGWIPRRGFGFDSFFPAATSWLSFWVEMSRLWFCLAWSLVATRFGLVDGLFLLGLLGSVGG